MRKLRTTTQFKRDPKKAGKRDKCPDKYLLGIETENHFSIKELNLFIEFATGGITIVFDRGEPLFSLWLGKYFGGINKK